MTLKQKRFRRVLVCTSCHRKKSKCDRNKPCSACIKSGNADSCTYTGIDNNPINISGVDRKISPEEIQTLIRTVEEIKESLKGDLPTDISLPISSSHQSTNDTFNIRRALNTNNFGEYKILHWKGSMNLVTMSFADPAAVLVHTYIINNKNHEWFNSSVYHEGLKKTGITMEALDHHASTYHGTSYINRIPENANDNDIRRFQTQASSYGDSIGVIFSEDKDWRNLSTIRKIEMFLPSREKIDHIVYVYFKLKLVGHHVLIEKDFKENLNRILGPVSQYDSAKRFAIQSRTDLAAIATLLMILRITYISLKKPFTNGNGVSTVHYEYLPCFADYPVPIDIVELASQLLTDFNYMVDAHLSVFQALMILLLYRLSAPEEEVFDDSADPRIFFVQVVEMAKSLYINQDTSYSRTWGGKHEDLHLSNYYRRTWRYLESLSLFICCFFSNNLSITLKDSNLLLPEIKPGDPDGDNDMSSAILLATPVINAIQVICERTFPLEASVPMTNLIEMFNNLESVLLNTFGTTADFFTPYTIEDGFSKVYKFLTLVQVKCIIMIYYYAFYVHYDSRGQWDKSSYFGRKLLEVSGVDLACMQKGLILKCEGYFGIGSWLTLVPSFLTSNRLQMATSRIRLRLHATIIHLSKSPIQVEQEKRIHVMRYLLNEILKIETQSLEFIGKLSRYQACAWWWFKSCFFGRRLVKEMDSSPDFKYTEEVLIRFSSEELAEWEKAVEKSDKMFKAFKVKFRTNHEVEEPLEDELLLLIQTSQIDKMWHGISYLKKFHLDRRFEYTLNGGNGEASGQSEFYAFRDYKHPEFDFDLKQYFMDFPYT